MTDINITQSNTILTNNKSKTDDTFVAEVEEGVMTDSNKTKMPPPKTTKTRLSMVSQQYDINKDGVLDEAELAMRNLDKSGRGFLTNDKIYALMQEQLAMQKSMFQMKRIIFGLLAFVVVLALANLGTSFASAVLAKDTTTSNGQLVDKKTNEAVATATAVETYTVQEDNGENARRLAECTSTNIGAYDACNTTVSSNTTMSNTSALAMLRNCEQGTEYVQLLRTYTSENITTIVTTTVCGPGWCSGGVSIYTMNTGTIIVDQREWTAGSIPVAGQLCIHDSTEKLNVTKTINNPGTYTLSRDMFVVPTGNAPTASPTTASPTTASPTTARPTTAKPTRKPTTARPTGPTAIPTAKPTRKPTTKPTARPTAPTAIPTPRPLECTEDSDCQDGKECNAVGYCQ